MKSSLIPEKPIHIYPSLAATIGLDESVLLSTLSDLVINVAGRLNNGYHWYQLPTESLESATPFWDRRDLQRVSTSLREKGIILIGSGPLLQEEQFKFAFNEKASAQPQVSPSVNSSNRATQSTPAQSPEPEPLRQATSFGGKNFIAANWQPEQATLAQLAQLSVPAEFAYRQVPEFVTYWRERNEAHRSWGQKFISHTIRHWRSFEEQEQRRDKATYLPADWSPTQRCLNDLTGGNIPQDFVLDQVREFVAYWQTSREKHLSWESKFIQRVQTEWARTEAKRNVSLQGYAMFAAWRPSADAMQLMCKQSEIPQDFIEDTVAEFIIYWRDKGTISNTWNSLFIKHVRLQWHRFQHGLTASTDPMPINSDWQPSKDVYEILTLANIDQNFAHTLVPEFILYWKDRNELHHSWNTRFLQHVKRNWAKQHQLGIISANPSRSTRDISLEEELNDTSWAN